MPSEQQMAYKVNKQAEVTDVDPKQGIVISYPATFDVIDSGMERFRKGAFARTIKAWGPEGKKRIKALFDHAPYWIVGRPAAMLEDEKGLRAETKFARTTMAKDVLTLIEDEIITEQSVGYMLLDSKPAKKREDDEGEDFPVLDLLEVKLFEYSFLAWGMNMDTPIIDVKAEMWKEMGHVSRALKEGNFETDEVPEMLERMLKRWQRRLDLFEEASTKLASDEDTGHTKSKPRPDAEGSSADTPPAAASVKEEGEGPDSGPTDLDSIHPESLGGLLELIERKSRVAEAEKAERELLREFASSVGLN